MKGKLSGNPLESIWLLAFKKWIW